MKVDKFNFRKFSPKLVFLSLIMLMSVVLTLSTSIQAGTALPPSLSAPDALGEAHLGGDYFGSLRGNANVSKTGSASYTIPIEVPPGINGMAPSLSLNYNSNAQNGLLGLGWSLGGISSRIRRCGQTLAQDGQIKAIEYNSNDKFCLDGSRLVAISGTYGANGTEYRTESDSFRRIISHSDYHGGPTYFTVEEKSGQTLTYSFVKSGGANPARLWALSKVEDQVGNYYTITRPSSSINGTYYQYTQERPLEINYTGNVSGGLTPFANIEFGYESRSDNTHQYAAGYLYDNQEYRLKTIKTYVDTSLVRVTTLNYNEVGYADQSRLNNITSCDAAGSCLEPVTLVWASDGSNISFAESNLSVPAQSLSFTQTSPTADTSASRWHDFNGDGSPDYLHIVKPSSITYTNSYAYKFYDEKPSIDFEIKLSGANGYQTEIWSNPVTDRPSDYDWQDMNGDGKTDVESFNRISKTVTNSQSHGTGGGTSYWYSSVYSLEIAYSTGSGFSNKQEFQLTTNEQTGSSNVTPRFERNIVDHKLADVDGDGLPDLIAIEESKLSTYNFTTGVWSYAYDYTFFVYRNTDSGFDSKEVWGSTGGCPYAYNICYTFSDMNADGRIDLVSHGINIHLSDGSEFTAGQDWGGGVSFAYADYNADGLPDKNVYINGVQYLYHNTGKSFVYAGPSTMLPYMELDANGLRDTYTRSYNFSTGKSSLNLYFAKNAIGDFQYQNLYTNVPGQNLFHQFTDINGDGMLDYTVAKVVSNKEIATLRVYTNGGKPLNQLKTINVGLGNEITFIYKPLTDHSIYTKKNDAVFPIKDVQNSRQVVTKLKRSDGIGGYFVKKYTYEGLKYDLDRRVSLGFSKIITENIDNNLTTYDTYLQEFPYTGQPLAKDFRRTSDNRRLNYNSYGYKLYGTLGSGTSFPYLYYINKYNYDPINGRKLSLHQTANFTLDAYGNVGNVRLLVREYDVGNNMILEQRDNTLSTYNIDLNNWRIGQALTKRERFWMNGAYDNTREKNTEYNYYSSTGLLKEVKQEPGEGGEFDLKTSLSYDNLGNITSAISSGPAISTRTFNITYNNRGQFPITATNALGHEEHASWDDRFGVQTSVTDSNGQMTQILYNGFGGLKQVTHPDGTYTHIFNNEDNTGGNLTAVSYTENISSGQPIVRTFYDQLGRVVRVRTQKFTGEYVHVDTKYNSKGQAYRVSEPYLAGQSTPWNTTTYDSVGRVIGLTAADAAKSVSIAYDGFNIATTDEKNHTTIQVSNALGQVIESEDAATNLTLFDYDAAGNRILVTNAVGTALENGVSYSYDRLRRLTSQDDPDHGLYTYTYDALGQKLTEVSPELAQSLQSRSFQYDLLGRMTSRTEPEGTDTWTYDNTVGGNLGIGRLHEESQSGYSRQHAYDSYYNGRLTSISTTIGTDTYTTYQSYNYDGKIDRITYPSSPIKPAGFEVKHYYNDLGFLERVQSPNGYSVYYQLLDTDAAGRVTQQWMGDGSILNQAYDTNSSRLLSQHTTNGANDIQHFTYSYDAAGNMDSRQDIVHGHSEAFDYDNLDRLTWAQVDNNAIANYNFDAVGNITQKMSNVYDYNLSALHAVNKVAQGSNIFDFAYDNNGNFDNGDDMPTITWSSYNKPLSLTQGAGSYQFSYGPDRSRYKKTQASVVTHYIGEDFEKIIVSGSSPSYRHVIRANGQAIMVRTETGGSAQHNYIHRDHLGSVTATTRQGSGLIKERMSYDAWGARRSATDWASAASPVTEKRGYTGHEHLDDVGIIHMNGRVYSPELGRMMSPDPVTQAPNSGQNYNRYTYANNNPLRYTDPSGYAFGDDIHYMNAAKNAGGCFGCTGTSVYEIFGTWDIAGLYFSYGSYGGYSSGNVADPINASPVEEVEANVPVVQETEEELAAQKGLPTDFDKHIETTVKRSSVQEGANTYSNEGNLLDALGNGGVVFGKRPLGDSTTPVGDSLNDFRDRHNIEVLHEQIFYGKEVNGELQLFNTGFFDDKADGVIRNDFNFPNNIDSYLFGPIYRDIPINRIESAPPGFENGDYNILFNNCQDFCSTIRGD